MRPVITLDQMQAVDAAADDLGHLIDQAGRAVARHAVSMLGGVYGRRVVVVVGPGHNGADGRVAAKALSALGVKVEVFAMSAPTVPACDLIIDAAVGAGLSRRYSPPVITGTPLILAVDVPSGLHGDSGLDLGGWTATRTVTFGAISPGHLLGSGPSRCGQVHVAQIGLDLESLSITIHHMDPHHAMGRLSQRAEGGHKWDNAVRVWAGGPGMAGAAVLASSAAMRAGAGIVVASRPDGEALAGLTAEVIERRTHLALDEDYRRFSASLIGPGIGRGIDRDAVFGFIAGSGSPVVVDADALGIVSADLGRLKSGSSVVVLTPHDGEFAQLTGARPGPDRIGAAQSLAAVSGAVVLLKGPTTIVASQNRAILVDAGDKRLATAGSGDVLAGVIAANLAACHSIGEVLTTVAACAVWHGTAGRMAGSTGVVASDIVDALPNARVALGSRDGGS